MSSIYLVGIQAIRVLMSELTNALDFDRVIDPRGQKTANYMSFVGERATWPATEGLQKGAPKLRLREARQLSEQLDLALPLQVAVCSKEDRRPSKSLRCFVHPRALPQQYIPITLDLYCASPALSLAFETAYASDIELIVYMSLLMSVFSRSEGGGLLPRRAITCEDELEAFFSHKDLGRLPKGFCRLAKLLPFAVAQAASPKELKLALLLSLPRDMGGSGFDKPQLNGCVRIPNSNRNRYCDLYWPAHNVSVEYDSDQEHSGVEALHSDAQRRNDLVAAGTLIFSVTSDQLSKFALLERVSSQLGRSIGAEKVPNSSAYNAKRRSLQEDIRSALNKAGF